MSPTRVLRGPIEVTYSSRLHSPTRHIDPACPGLERTPVEARAVVKFINATELGRDEQGRLCRICTLERVLRSTLRPGRARNAERILVTFNADPVTDYDIAPFPNRGDSETVIEYGQASPSGERRVRRLGRILDLRVQHTPFAGVTCTGEIDPVGARILERNLRAYRIGNAGPEYSEEHIETFWTLVRDPNRVDVDQIWETAGLLAAPHG